MAVFAGREDQDPALNRVLLTPPLGTCTTFTGATAPGSQPSFSLEDAPLASAHATALDAGPRITVANGDLLRPLSPILGASGFYEQLLGEQRGGRSGRGGPLFLEPGSVVIAGEGGADVGPFTVPVPAPEPFVWKNRDSLSTVDRRLGVTLRWRPLSQAGVTLIGLTSVDPSAAAWGACFCAAEGASGAFTIPPAVLANLPASQPAPAVPAPSLWLTYVPFRNQQPLHARGLDNGLAISLFMQALEVVVR
jgi:hypothetical protein